MTGREKKNQKGHKRLAQRRVQSRRGSMAQRCTLRAGRGQGGQTNADGADRGKMKGVEVLRRFRRKEDIFKMGGN